MATSRDALTLLGTSPATRTKILVVDDDRGVCRLLTRYLELSGYEVETSNNVTEAADALANRPPDLMLLDVMLPPDDGLDLLTRVRQESDLAVIMVTGNGEETDRVMGLRLGADDYVVKPFSPAEIEARIASVLRRSRPVVSESLEFDGLCIDVGTREVRVAGELVSLTAKEFDLLAFLAASPRHVFSRAQLLDKVWRSSSAWQSTDTVTEHVRRIRRRIEPAADSPEWITTIWGVGYRFNN